MTQAVVTALENEMRQDRKGEPQALRLRAIAAKAKTMAGPDGREMNEGRNR